MKCPFCPNGTLTKDVRDLPWTYKGRTTLITGIGGLFCDQCSESIPDDEDGDRLMSAMQAFKLHVNRESVEPEVIVACRRRLGLDQRQAAEVFGGGANAFSRYETGVATPPKSLVTLLLLLDRHPELVSEVVPAAFRG